jgi:hypothetical protein
VVVGYIAHVGGIRDVYRILVRKLKGRNLFEIVGIDGRIMLRFIVQK